MRLPMCSAQVCSQHHRFFVVFGGGAKHFSSVVSFVNMLNDNVRVRSYKKLMLPTDHLFHVK